MIRVTRKYRFSASHRLHSAALRGRREPRNLSASATILTATATIMRSTSVFAVRLIRYRDA